MLEETRRQPDALQRTLDHSAAAIARLRRRFEANRPRLIVLAARGTSDNAAQFGRYLLEITTQVPVSLAAPSVVTVYRSGIDLRDVVVVGVSQSGESTDTNAVLMDARERGAFTIGITNEGRSTLARTVDAVLLVRAGKESSVAATKTYTGQLLAFYLLAHALGGAVRLEPLQRIPGWVERVLRLESRIAALAERYRFMARTVTVGRGLNYANALEFGLKLMETCYVLAEGFSAADLMHGPIALIENSFPVFVFAPAGATWPSVEGVIDRLEALGADTLLIADAGNRPALRKARVLELPAQPGPRNGMPDLYTPIPYIVPAQLFAAHLAASKGLNPDRPRTLEKITRTM
jgi:glucosamine--fructose-6-phosphate aminotransferase (isomerizing)